ncbi:sensor histidine kinase [Paenibacillus marinisediminis]
MRLFIREQLPLIGFNIVQMLVVLLVYWLDGYDRWATALYAMSLGLFITFIYLCYRYISHREFYRSLSEPDKLPSDALKRSGAPLSAALNELQTVQHREYKQQLRTWEREKKQYQDFINQWVHQMKTPLSVIELITQDGDDPRFESITEETDRLRHGLEMVLYMARRDTFAEDFHVHKVSLRKLVNEVIQDNRRSFIRHYVYPEIEIDDSITVETDAKWLRFIVQQLISNAIKYSAGSREKVTLKAYPQERAVILEVIDRGAGIPQSDLSRVWDAFYTGENGRVYKESTGMGLYLVKEAIDRLHHQIELESTVGAGTTVRIRFPYAGK